MKTKEFFEKYNEWFTDSSNDSRGVLGAMDKNASIPYPMFRNDVRSSHNLPILVEYYHPEKPYFWGNPLDFPYTKEYGPGPGEKPYIIKRSLNWYIVPEKAKIFKPLCFTILRWNFEVTVLVFNKPFIGAQFADRSQGIDLERLYSRKEIDHFLETHLTQRAPGDGKRRRK